MRLFVAVVPPADAVAHLDTAAGIVRGDFPDLSWIPASRWHLTLAFLGSVAESVLADFLVRLQRAAGRSEALSLAFAGADSFGNQVFWIGVAGDNQPLCRLADATRVAARRCGLAPDQRPYRPHLTLARARQPVDLRPAVAAMAGYTGPVWTARGIAVVRSVLGPAAPSYETVLVVPLG